MRPLWFVCALLLLPATPVRAQDPPPRIGPFVVDVRGTLPRFKQDAQLAASRALLVGELPGSGLGLDLNVHVYFFTWKAVTFGLGGQLTLAQAQSSAQTDDGQAVARAVTERLTSVTPQISFNFGTGDGWSYISGGIGPTIWSVVPAGRAALPPDEERLQTINYGGGARWFVKPHLAFTFDVRFHAINPSTGFLGFPGGPRTTMLIIGAGISVK
jgi:hypothetical protein